MEENAIVLYRPAAEIIKTAILQGQYEAAKGVNRIQLAVYFGIGKFVSQNTRKGVWGTGALESISQILRKELPGLKGYSASSMKNMRKFYENWQMLDPNSSVTTDDNNSASVLVEMESNKSTSAIVVTDEDRTFFRITIPCHEAAGNIIADIATREKTPDSSQEVDKNIPDVLKDVLKNVQKDVLKKLTERQIDILELIVLNPTITLNEMSKRIDVSVKTIQRDFTAVRELGIQINRKDGKTYGEWEVLSKE